MTKKKNGRISVARTGEVLVASGGTVHRTGWSLVLADCGFPGLVRARMREVSGTHVLAQMKTGLALVKSRHYMPRGGMPMWGVEFVGPVIDIADDEPWQMTRARFEELTGWAAPPAGAITGICASTNGAGRPEEDYGQEA